MDPVWENTIDGGLFEAKVQRLSPYRGKLTVKHVESNTILRQEEVGLSYDAVFGPDVSDLYAWQQLVLAAVDHWYEDHGQEPPD